jgi:hypothetical protein
MCGRRGDSTTLPALTGPVDPSFGYRVTEEGMKALAEYEKRHGKPTLPKVRLPDTVAEALEAESWRERTRRRRKAARACGRRLVTVCGKWRRRRRVPDLRLMGLWLRTAGFEPGQQCEVEVAAGTLTVRAI